jgi:imidazolonepropionase
VSAAAPFDLVVHNTSEVLTVHAPPGNSSERALGPIPHGAVGVRDGKIAYLGPEAGLSKAELGEETLIIDANGGFVGPGFVDPHTHLVFAGDRSREFEQRNQGASYLEIAKSGGGIMSTVAATRAASMTELVALALPRLGRLLEHGVTSAEVKSGYGLSLPDELKMLKAIKDLSDRQPVELHATLLCAHALPTEYRAHRQAYLDLCIQQILPAVAAEGLARFCDVFAEEGAFTLEEAHQVLEAGKKLGLAPKLHTDQLTPFHGAELGAQLKAASVDHLEEVSTEGIVALAQSGVPAVLIPTATLFLHQGRFAPGRRLWDEGVPVALATNVNPGSAMSENHALTLGLACLKNGLTAAEAYWAATRGGALALRLPHHGELVEGGPADLVVFSCSSYHHLPYHLGVNHARWVVKSGRVVVDKRDLSSCNA